MSQPVTIVTTSDRPDLVPLVAEWLWTAFGHQDGHSLAQTHAAVRQSVTADPMPRTFILLQAGEPVGTASLADRDLEERPDLTPWLAGVFVAPHARRRGHAVRLVVAVEQAARDLGIPVLWLYTNSAERLYAAAGWVTAETVQHNGKPCALMRRQLLA